MRYVLAAALLLVLAGAWLSWPRTPAPETTNSTTPTIAANHPRAESPDRRGLGPDDEPARARPVREGAGAREAMRQRILDAAAARAASTSPTRAATVADDEPAARERRARKPAAGSEDAAPPQAPLQDRTGNHAYLARVLDEQLMPLVDECHALARETHPDIAGLLDLNVEILGDEDIGGVIDSLEPAPTNEIKDAGLLECVRESLLSVTLPPPKTGGRDAIMLSLRLDPPEKTP